MCKISTQLKLCTCKTREVETLKHYWILYRPDFSGMEILGSIIDPADITQEIALYNEGTLNILLNAGNCFDVDINVKEKDVLQLYFSCRNSYLTYAFTFKKNKWISTAYDLFANDLAEKLSGKIKQPFAKS
ncbi:hypothetical protein [Daejeonella oryzae]|uniref:hypothetical protein n=1 Tax=Daejeonella oryzae TaxID=1122943 RepID=UPI00055CF1CD|nr:hypothetical protein [Daejeonella oryzae]